MRADRLVKSHFRVRYLVTMASGEAFEGVLVDADPQHLVLADAQAVGPDNTRTAVDGWLWLPRPGIQYMQQPKA